MHAAEADITWLDCGSREGQQFLSHWWRFQP